MSDKDEYFGLEGFKFTEEWLRSAWKPTDNMHFDYSKPIRDSLRVNAYDRVGASVAPLIISNKMADMGEYIMACSGTYSWAKANWIRVWYEYKYEFLGKIF